MNNKGLYAKYNVSKTSDGSVVNDCFVLRPEQDSAAETALRVYAAITSNPKLEKDLLDWLGLDQITAHEYGVYTNRAKFRKAFETWPGAHEDYGDTLCIYSEIDSDWALFLNLEERPNFDDCNKHNFMYISYATETVIDGEISDVDTLVPNDLLRLYLSLL